MEVVGDDSAGRKIIIVSACKLPPIGKEAFNHAKLLRSVYGLACKMIEITISHCLSSSDMMFACHSMVLRVRTMECLIMKLSISDSIVPLLSNVYISFQISHTYFGHVCGARL